jgi:hypothetical protein
MWSIAAEAADAAEDSPRASIIACSSFANCRNKGVFVPILIVDDFWCRAFHQCLRIDSLGTLSVNDFPKRLTV